MKLFLIVALLFGFANSALSNDGAYYSRGGVFYPMNETRISIKKEILTFKCEDRKSSVNIYFEFFNPESENITSTIGFVAPFAVGDVSANDVLEKGVKNFRVQHEGEFLSYQLKMADCPDCELRDTSGYDFSQWDSKVFVYLFEMTFTPGINKVSHSYDFTASRNVVFDQQYEYTLTTGAKWAGSKIKDLTVEIEMEGDNYFFVNDMFGSESEWMVVGSGKVSDKYITLEDKARMVRMISGKLVIHVTDFEPKTDFFFGLFREESYCFYGLTDGPMEGNVSNVLCSHELNEDAIFTKKELRLIRNGIYAQYGYAFNSKELTDYFNEYGWYIPDPNLRMSDIHLSQKDNELIQQILELEWSK